MQDLRLVVQVDSHPRVLGFLTRLYEVFMEELCREWPQSMVPQRLEVALSEAVSNAIFHGHGDTSEAAIEVELQVDGKALELMMAVSDSGPGFNIDAVQPPADALREGGRGIFLMRQMVDRIESIKTGRGHTLRMWKTL